MADKIRLRGETEEDWISHDPIISKRECVLTLNSSGLPVGIKAGDGVKKWSELAHLTGFDSVESDPVFLEWLSNYVETNQVNSDWNATTGVTFILNKPSLGNISAKDYWSGTLAAYTAITTKSANTIYFIEE